MDRANRPLRAGGWSVAVPARLPPSSCIPLRSWLLHQGREEKVGAELFVHPQTVRYRMARLRELYGDRLHDPGWLLRLTVALAVPAATSVHATRVDSS